MKKRTLFTAALCGALTIALTAAPGFAQVSTSPGKKAAFETAKGVILQVYPHTVLTAAIVKGRPKHVITVDGMVRLDLPPGVATLSLGARVDGPNCWFEMHPTGTMGTMESALQECPGVGMGCTVTGTFILDLDAAEQNCPGGILNQPLTIRLEAGDAGPGGGAGQPVDVSMIVRMEKKQ